MKPHWTQPSHPDVVEVVTQSGSFASYSRAAKSYPPGALLATLSAPTLTLADRAYSSVQVGSTENVELNSDFLYINHSCEPNLEFHVLNSEKLDEQNTSPGKQRLDSNNMDHPIVIEFRVAARKDADGNTIGLKKGEELSFFYPSTEWNMEQAFECKCKTDSCKGLIRGAKYLSKDDLDTYFINDHILRLLQDSRGSSTEGSFNSTPRHSDKDLPSS